jgi:hypothetical protein
VTETKTLTTVYVPGEGRHQLDECMEATFAYCRDHEIGAVVIYTSNGEGPCRAVERFQQSPDFASIRIVAVTPPANRPYVANPQRPVTEREVVYAGVFGEKRKLLIDANVPIVSARLPFRSALAPDDQTRPALSLDPMQTVDRALGILGGGFSFCIQVALMACDAGVVRPGERIAVMSADTAMVVIACQSESFLSPADGLLVEHIICRPLLYDISKRNHVVTEEAVRRQSDDQQLALQLGTVDDLSEGNQIIGIDAVVSDKSNDDTQ